MAQRRQDEPGSTARNRHAGRTPEPGFVVSRQRRTIRTAPPSYRWECACQDPPVLLATWDPGGRINIKVRDRYWHLFGFGQVQAICPRCAAEHVLDLGRLDEAIEPDEPGKAPRN